LETNQIANEKSINISGIPAGVYFINVKGDTKSIARN
jgi:hypothetical protein